MSLMDLNADLGESFGNWPMGDDEGLLPLVSSASAACGFHAGDPSTMRRSVQLARDAGVSLGAHPGFPDLLGFGRRELAATAAEIADYVTYQVGALSAFAQAEGVKLAHVKPHGALYPRAARDVAVAVAITDAMHAIDPGLMLILPPSPGAERAVAAGATVALEAYVDLDYDADGIVRLEKSIGPRDPEAVADRAVEIAGGRVTTDAGKVVEADFATICVHGDGPNAVGLAQAIRTRFAAEGIEVAPLARVLDARSPAAPDAA
jgi:UPF0271 protein